MGLVYSFDTLNL